MRYLASIRYDGSKFYGFQRLNKHKTVQGELEKVLTKLNKNLVEIKGAGRTDRGVHAYNQVVHFDLNIDIPVDNLKTAINSMIDDGIYVNYCEIVDEDFHARFLVKEKVYQYVINFGDKDPLCNNYLYNYCRDLDIQAMKKASKYLLGYHSFKAFVSGERENYDNVIYNIKFKKKKEILVITFTGKSFYRYMVRNLIGALFLVGEGKIIPEDIEEMLNKEKNIYNYMTVPAQGLYLVDVKY